MIYGRQIEAPPDVVQLLHVCAVQTRFSTVVSEGQVAKPVGVEQNPFLFTAAKSGQGEPTGEPVKSQTRTPELSLLVQPLGPGHAYFSYLPFSQTRALRLSTHTPPIVLQSAPSTRQPLNAINTTTAAPMFVIRGTYCGGRGVLNG